MDGGVTDLVSLDQLLEEADNMAGDLEDEVEEPTTEELTSLQSFCMLKFEIRSIKEQAKAETSALRQKASELRAHLEDHFRSSQGTILQIHDLDAEASAPESVSIPKYVRMKQNTTTRTLKSEVVREAILAFAMASLEAELSRMRAKAKEGTTVSEKEAILRVIQHNIKMQRTSMTHQVVLTSKLPKKKSEHVVHPASEDVRNLAALLHQTNELLRLRKEERRAKLRTLEELVIKLEPAVMNYLVRNTLERQRVATNSGAEFYIRRKVSQKSTPLRVKDVTQGLSTLIDSHGLDVRSILANLESFANMVADLIEDRPLETKEIVTVDKVTQRKKRGRDDDEDEAMAGPGGEAIEDDDDDEEEEDEDDDEE